MIALTALREIEFEHETGKMDDADRDQDYSKEEFKLRLAEYLKKQDEDLREILTKEQFTIHKEIYGEFLRSAYKRWGIEM